MSSTIDFPATQSSHNNQQLEQPLNRTYNQPFGSMTRAAVEVGKQSMITTAIIILAFAFTLSPLLAFAWAIHKRRAVFRERSTTVAAYYAATLFGIFIALVPLHFARVNGISTRITLSQSLLIAGLIGLLGLVVLGPFIAMDLLASIKELSSRYCPRCNYDLTGNITGQCSECGAPVPKEDSRPPTIKHRLKAIPWLSFLPLYALTLIVTALAVCHVNVTNYYYCSECGRIMQRPSHQFCLPFSGTKLFELHAQQSSHNIRQEAITSYLDPDNNCLHNWITNGSDGEGLFSSWKQAGPSPVFCSAAEESDFRAFLQQHPEFLDRIRMDLRQRQSIKAWSYEQYFKWKDSQPSDQQPTLTNAPKPTPQPAS